MREALICEPLRTAVGRFGGMYRDVPAQALGTAVLRGLLERTRLPVNVVDDVLFAQCYPSMDAPALGRVVALDAGLPVEVGGLQIDRRCGSGLQAIVYAAMQVATGASDVVIAGGAESMSNAPFYSTQARWGIKGDSLAWNDSLARGRITAGGINFPVPGGMIETAENLRRQYAVSRAEQDAFSVESHRRAVAAQASGVFAQEIVPVTVGNPKGPRVLDQDEHPRPDATI
jgi:acetyl-CoA C-acetyltransferase